MIAGPSLAEVWLCMTDDSPTQPRTAIDPEKQSELRDSMRAHGWLPTHPLFLRPKPGPGCVIRPVKADLPEGLWEILHPDTMRDVGNFGAVPKSWAEEFAAGPGAFRYERVDGHRRTYAATDAGIGKAPAVIRELTDGQVLEFQFIENDKQERLNPIEEAAHLSRMLECDGPDGKKHTVETLARRINKSDEHVKNTLFLLNLDAETRAALVAKEGRLSLVIGYELGRIPSEKARAAAAKEILHPAQGESPMRLKAAQDYLRRSCTRNLRGATFDTSDDALLPLAPACIGCNFNSAFSPDGGKRGPNLGTCCDVDCFERKETAGYERWRASHHAPDKGRTALSRERCAEIFDVEGVLDWQSCLVDLAAKPDAGLLRADVNWDTLGTWNELVAGRLAEVSVARDTKGKRRDLADTNSAKAAAELNGHLIFKTSGASKVASSRKKSDETPHREATLQLKEQRDDSAEYLRRLDERLRSTIAGKVRALGVFSPMAWLLVLKWLCGTAVEGAKKVEARRGIEHGHLCEVLSMSEAPEIAGALVEILVADCYANGDDEFADEIISFFGVSVKEAAAAVKAEMDAEEPAKKNEPTAEENAVGLLASARAAFNRGADTAELLDDELLVGVAKCAELLATILREREESGTPALLLPDGCVWKWDKGVYDWNGSAVCPTPDVVAINFPKREKVTLEMYLAVGRVPDATEDAWFFGWHVKGPGFKQSAYPTIAGTGSFTKERALAYAAAVVANRVASAEKISPAVRERCAEIAAELAAKCTEAAGHLFELGN